MLKTSLIKSFFAKYYIELLFSEIKEFQNYHRFKYKSLRIFKSINSSIRINYETDKKWVITFIEDRKMGKSSEQNLNFSVKNKINNLT